MRVGGSAVAANDEFFAPKENLLLQADATFEPGRYTDRGKWMDGWETRRRREPGNDWCVVRLGVPGVVRGVVVDTAHFRGNHPESASVDGVRLDVEPARWDDVAWEPLVPRSPLAGDAKNTFGVAGGRLCTHVRLSIFPDGVSSRPVTESSRRAAKLPDDGCEYAGSSTRPAAHISSNGGSSARIRARPARVSSYM